MSGSGAHDADAAAGANAARRDEGRDQCHQPDRLHRDCRLSRAHPPHLPHLQDIRHTAHHSGIIIEEG